MHSGYEIPPPGIHQQAADNTCAPALLSMNPTHLLDQIRTLPVPATQQLFLDQHHFLPPHHHHHQNRLTHHYLGGASTAYFPLNFKLGLNEVCTGNDYKGGPINVSSAINDGGGGAAAEAAGGDGDALLRGSEQYQVPEEARHSSLGMLHCWQNREDSAIKQQPAFWEPLPEEVSNENSEIVDRQEHLEMNQKEATAANCLDSKRRVHFSELEAIYKRLGAVESNQTDPSDQVPPASDQLQPAGLDHGSEASIGEEASQSMKNNARKKKKREGGCNHMINPMMEYFGDLVKKVMDHQENLHKKFAKVMERLDGERRAREEAWRNQGLAHFEQEAAARARERALAQSREDMIVSYLEKISGQRIILPSINPTVGNGSASTSDDFPGHNGGGEGLKLKTPGS